MSKLRKFAHKNGNAIGYTHWCPACDEYHALYVEESHPITGAHWKFNGNVDKPTFTPSVRVNSGSCHYLITDGVIEYLLDSLHPYAGRAIEMPDEEGNKWQAR